MKLIKLFGTAALALGLLVQSAFAHHSTNGIYNEEIDIEITGRVKAWRFINPHPSLTLEVTNSAGVVEEWDVSYGGSAVTHLVRRGYSADTFKVGETITLSGHPALLETAHGILMEGQGRTPVRADGTPVVPAQGSR
ncbi:DUF6152 family protein [Sulfuriflexus sp.]|uniref:DUF6152 family protein n=1 Tax=Sulfuriflexus sp. TaxID=2015443 RepID=UPI0028CE84C8|nr:DUF6152 family protein [Sulfuriflexus sp.]MDT8405529.1 DUF6152 family protein [Sulfuriflexus sp.]